jgi:hypothetical protein
MGARTYVPALGRWLTPDPKFSVDPGAVLRDPSQGNLFAYVGNSPLSFIDPGGRDRNDPPTADGAPGYAPGADPAAIPPDGSVDYYVRRAKDFMRRNPNMDPPDYYMNYGAKYRRAFGPGSKFYRSASAEGRGWSDRTGVLLQRAIENLRQKSPAIFAYLERHPDKFREFTFSTHPDAYLEGGIADLMPYDQWLIMMTPDADDVLSPSGIKQAIITAGGTAKRWGHNIKVNTQDNLSEYPYAWRATKATARRAWNWIWD